jgi:hypothetical protein
MTQDQIIEMAKQVGMDYLQYISPEAFEKVVAFVELVAQHERNEIIEILDASTGYVHMDAIRERGQA